MRDYNKLCIDKLFLRRSELTEKKGELLRLCELPMNILTIAVDTKTVFFDSLTNRDISEIIFKAIQIISDEISIVDSVIKKKIKEND